MVWNPVRGCSRVSPGCINCYAEKVAARFSGPGLPYEGLTNAQGRWNGVVREVPEHLGDPLRWRKPRRIFVNSMSDLFHESLSEHAIVEVFRVMAQCPQHTFQILTKRAERMRDLLTGWKRIEPDSTLPNVWLGVSVENQDAADERIPHLLATPAAVRFLSVEPLISSVTFRPKAINDADMFRLTVSGDGARPMMLDGIGWVIVGGESGPGARPCDIGWIRHVVEQCKAAGVPVFVKQIGARPTGEWHHPDSTPEPMHGILREPIDGRPHPFTGDGIHRLLSKKGGDMEEWPADLRVREFPEPAPSPVGEART